VGNTDINVPVVGKSGNPSISVSDACAVLLCITSAVGQLFYSLCFCFAKDGPNLTWAIFRDRWGKHKGLIPENGQREADEELKKSIYGHHLAALMVSRRQVVPSHGGYALHCKVKVRIITRPFRGVNEVPSLHGFSDRSFKLDVCVLKADIKPRFYSA